jgi:hypothetical protein
MKIKTSGWYCKMQYFRIKMGLSNKIKDQFSPETQDQIEDILPSTDEFDENEEYSAKYDKSMQICGKRTNIKVENVLNLIENFCIFQARSEGIELVKQKKAETDQKVDEVKTGIVESILSKPSIQKEILTGKLKKMVYGDSEDDSVYSEEESSDESDSDKDHQFGPRTGLQQPNIMEAKENQKVVRIV